MGVELTLTNCPFCGGEARIDAPFFAATRVTCTKCGSCGPIKDEVLEAIQLWNKRGGLGNTRVALVDASIPINTFKLGERIREMTDRLERGDLGEPTVGVALLLDEARRQMTMHGLRISKLEAEPLVRAAFDAIQASKQVECV